MGFKFRKSIKLAPGVKLNLGKKSVGVSVGGKVAGVSYNTRTGAHARVSAPGTGMSYTTKIGGADQGRETAQQAPVDDDLHLLDGEGLVPTDGGGAPQKPQKPNRGKGIALAFVAGIIILGVVVGTSSGGSDAKRPATTRPRTETTTTGGSGSGSTHTGSATTKPDTPSTPSTPSTTPTTPTATPTEPAQPSTSAKQPTTPTPDPTPAPDPTPEPEPEPDPAPAEREIPHKENYHGHVYATKSGECYHYEAGCGGKNAKEITWDIVDSRHLRPCSKCVLK